jgi:anti-sigma B factor antagonist
MNREVLHIGIRESGTTRVLKLTGELDSYTSDRLRSICETWMPGARKMVVNLDKLQYIDSSGLAALVGMWVRARDSGVELVLTCRNRRVNQIMEITGLSRLFAPDGSRLATGIIPQSAYTAAGMVPAAATLATAAQPNVTGPAGMTAGKAA